MSIKPIRNEKDYEEALERLEVIFDAKLETPGNKTKGPGKDISYKSRVSEILNKKRKLTFSMIRKLHEQLNIPTNILIKDY